MRPAADRHAARGIARRGYAGALLATWLVAACGGAGAPAGPAPNGPLSIAIVSGDGVADTVGATLASPLVVQVLDSAAHPVRDTLISFGACCGVLVTGPTDSGAYYPGALLRTDSTGYARAYVRFGSVPDSARITVQFVDASDSSVAHYLVLPGNLARITLGIADSAAYVGHGYDLGARPVDRLGNPRADLVTYAADDSVLSADSLGHVTALAIGRSAVVVRAGAVTDTAWVTVPPHGVIAAYDVGGGAGDDSGVVMFQLDGSGYRVLDKQAGEWPSWAPGGRVLITAADSGAARLFFVDTLGDPPARALPVSPLTSELFGSESRNGTWLYFSSGNDLWRAHPDGSGATNLGVDSLFSNSQSRPSASADGGRVVVLSAPPYAQTVEPAVVDPAAGTVTRLAVASSPALPRWSPSDSLILYWDTSALWVTTPAGTGTHQVSPQGVQYLIGEDWSPDGQWLITRRPNLLELLNLATGERLPLPYGIRFIEPSWAP